MGKSLDHIRCEFIIPEDYDEVVNFAREYFLRVTITWNYKLSDDPMTNDECSMLSITG